MPHRNSPSFSEHELELAPLSELVFAEDTPPKPRKEG